jgi:hypothetical protein
LIPCQILKIYQGIEEPNFVHAMIRDLCGVPEETAQRTPGHDKAVVPHWHRKEMVERKLDLS